MYGYHVSLFLSGYDFFSIRVSTLPYINNKAVYSFCSSSTVLCVKRRLRESSRLAQKTNPNPPPNMVFKLTSTLNTSHSLLSYFLSIHWYVSHLKPALVQDSEHQFSQLIRNIPNIFFFYFLSQPLAWVIIYTLGVLPYISSCSLFPRAVGVLPGWWSDRFALRLNHTLHTRLSYMLTGHRQNIHPRRLNAVWYRTV